MKTDCDINGFGWFVPFPNSIPVEARRLDCKMDGKEAEELGNRRHCWRKMRFPEKEGLGREGKGDV